MIQGLGASILGPVLLFAATGIANAADGPLNIDSHVSDNFAELNAHQRNSADAHIASTVQARPRIVRTYVPACQGNFPQLQRNLGALCEQATGLCASTPDPDDLGYWVYTAPAGPPDPGRNDWTSTGEVICRGETQPPDEIEPVVTLADFRRLPLPAAELRVQPPNRQTLINIPTNLYADSRVSVLPTTILGFAVRSAPPRYIFDGLMATAKPSGPRTPADRTPCWTPPTPTANQADTGSG